MFSFNTGIIEAMDLRKGTLVFRSRRDYSPGELTTLKMALPPGTGKVKSVEVQVSARRSDQNGSGIYTARVLTDLGNFEYHGNDIALRDAARAYAGIRVMSKDLPRYRAMTVDLSATGAQLETDESVALGKHLLLQFDLDNYVLSKIVCMAEVIWCRPAPHGGRFRTGVKFIDSEPPIPQQLHDLAEYLYDRSNSDLQDLLEQAKLLPPPGPGDIPSPPAPANVAIAPLAPPPPPTAAHSPGATHEERRHAPRALLLPLRALLKGYRRSHVSGSLVLSLVGEEGDPQELEFLECQYFLDLTCSSGKPVVALRSTLSSDLLDQLEARLGTRGGWKHYQLLDESGEVIVELASRQCRPFKG